MNDDMIERAEYERDLLAEKRRGAIAGFLFAGAAMLIVGSIFILFGWV